VLEGASLLSSSQRWGIAVASAAVSRNRELLEAVIAQARGAAGDDLVDDALAALALGRHVADPIMICLLVDYSVEQQAIEALALSAWKNSRYWAPLFATPRAVES